MIHVIIGSYRDVDSSTSAISARPHITERRICRLVRLHSGHVTLLGAEFQPLKLSPSRNYGAGRPHVGLCPNV